MLRFITTTHKKERRSSTRSNHGLLERVRRGENVCVAGGVGAGKTSTVRYELDGDETVIDVDRELVRSRPKMAEFVDKIRGADVVLFVDDLDALSANERGGWRELVERGFGDTTRGVVVTSETPVAGFETVFVAPMTKRRWRALGRAHVGDNARMDAAWAACRGDVRAYLSMLASGATRNARDAFVTPADQVNDILCGPTDPMALIAGRVGDHGYMQGVIHANWPDAGVDDMSAIADALSVSDLVDAKIYETNEWDQLFPYFVATGIVEPAVRVGHRLDRGALRAGSVWSTMLHGRMRRIKFADVCRRTGITLDHVRLVVRDMTPEAMYALGVRRGDMDTLNHVCMRDKLPTRKLAAKKRALKLLAAQT